MHGGLADAGEKRRGLGGSERQRSGRVVRDSCVGDGMAQGRGPRTARLTGGLRTDKAERSAREMTAWRCAVGPEGDMSWAMAMGVIGAERG